jgi:hypothetical protein
VRVDAEVSTGHLAPERKPLQIANPKPLQVLGVCVGTVLQENRLHLEFERHRVSGEWHASHPEILERIATINRVDVEISP